jgi:predicted nucleic acid-binding protein
MIIVSDTSPISALLKCNRVELLKQLFFQVVVPQKVFDELLVLERSGIDVQSLLTASWIQILSPENKLKVEEFSDIVDSGEAEAIVLALELKAEILLIDDLAGRILATEQGLATKGLLGILVEAQKQNILPDAKLLVDTLRQNGTIWVSERVYQVFLKALNMIAK